MSAKRLTARWVYDRGGFRDPPSYIAAVGEAMLSVTCDSVLPPSTWTARTQIGCLRYELSAPTAAAAKRGALLAASVLTAGEIRIVIRTGKLAGKPTGKAAR